MQVRVFISSTYKDLISERAHIRELCAEIDEKFVGMEIFRSSSKQPLEVSLRYLKQSDVAIFIIGQRYGSIDGKTGQSIVEREYNTTIQLRKCIKLYFRHEKVPVVLDCIDVENQDKIKSFRQRLSRTHTYRQFANPDELRWLVTLDLFDISYKVGHRDFLDYSVYERYTEFWQDTFKSKEVDIIIEVGKYTHEGEIEQAKNINGTLGVALLTKALTEQRAKHNIQPARKGLAMDRDIILDGSHAGNIVTKSIVDSVSKKLPHANKNSAGLETRWISAQKNPRIKAFQTKYRKSKGEAVVEYDYGFLARIKNPQSKEDTCLIASGNHGAGTYACMKVLTAPSIIGDLLDSVDGFEFQAVIGIECGAPYEFGQPVIHEIANLK